MWNPVEDTGSHYTVESIPKQKVLFKELKSIERPQMPPVFVQTVPLTGHLLSDIQKEVFGHWLPILVADRINIVEGIVDDLLHLRVQNFWKEMGLNSEWKYNRKNFVKKTVVTTLLLAGVVGLFMILTSEKKKDSV